MCLTFWSGYKCWLNYFFWTSTGPALFTSSEGVFIKNETCIENVDKLNDDRQLTPTFYPIFTYLSTSNIEGKHNTY